MKNLARRLRKLEAARFDSSGLVPRSDEWFAYYADIFDREMRGERPEYHSFPIEAFDYFVEAADRADREQRT